MSRKHVFDYEAVIETAQVIDHLEKVLTGLKSGTLVIGNEGTTHEIKPTKLSKFELEIKESEVSQTLKLKMKWNTSLITETSSNGPLTVNSV